MRIHIIQHLAHEHAASIIDWIKERDHIVSSTYLFQQSFAFPALNDFDMLLILGGTMGAYEEHKYPWLHAEKKFIRQAIDANKLVLGICLGSQILAEVLGSKVYPHTEKEIGFFPIHKTEAAIREDALADMPASWTVFHWHGDTFDLPPGAVHLFFSEGCKNQGFKKDRCFGFQFHGEINENLLHAMLDHGRNEIIESHYVQSEAEINMNKDLMIDNIPYFYSFLDRITTSNQIRIVDAPNMLEPLIIKPTI